MLLRCVQLLGNDRVSRRSKELKGSIRIRTSDPNKQLKDITVRIVHAGGLEECYQSAVPASRLIDKYPGMCVVRPNIFIKPYESIVSAKEQLLPGQKYYLVPSTTVQKLKHRHLIKEKVEEPKIYKEPISGTEVISNADGEDYSVESMYTAKDFYLFKERPSKHLPSKSEKIMKPFVPPIQKPVVLKRLGWKPSLTSIEELSP